MLNGVLDLLSNLISDHASALRNNFVFKVIPCLNPDGVARGYYRFDTYAQNLNRFWKDPDVSDHPTIWAAKHAIL